MSGLPAGLADPLHLEPPFPWGRLVLLALALAWAVWRLWRWWRRRRGRRPTPAPAPSAPSAPAVPAGELELAVRRILRYHRRRARRGCHQLARLLRAHFGDEVGNRTARELRRARGDTPLTRLFLLLSELRFGRRQPSYGDLEGACELALDVARSRAVEAGG